MLILYVILNFANRMKLIERYILTFVLSLMIVFMGSGRAIVQCCHRGYMSVTAVETAQGHGCAEPARKCMKVKVVKLSQFSQASQASFQFHSFAVALPLFLMAVGFALRQMPYTHMWPRLLKAWSSPPRTQLHKLRRLTL